MSLLSFIFDLNCGGLQREAPMDDDEEAPLAESDYCPPAVCQCNNCGRTFHETWLHHWCPAGCGGRIYRS